MNELDAARDKVLRDNTAQTVFKYLEDIDNNKPDYELRWIWELLQNARDAASADSPSIVDVSLSHKRFVFRHNGAPFRKEEIAHLIYYGSSKRDPDASDPIGQFGSGFLTSHILSKRVHVAGVMQDGNGFSFVLNREGATPQQLSDAMNRSWEDFKASLHERRQPAQFTTEYSYDLSDTTLPFAAAGLDALWILSPYTLAFNSKFRELQLSRATESLRSWVPDEGRTDLSDGVSLLVIRNEKDGRVFDRSLAIATNESVSVAVMTNDVDGKTTVALDGACPRLFIAFPLFGTERFCFPVVINSERFKPQEKRDGIYLGAESTEVIVGNRALIESACDLYAKLLACAAKQGWLGLPRLALLPEYEAYRWIDAKWYRELLTTNVVTPARNTPILSTHPDSSLTTPKSARIPLQQSGVTVDEIWQISVALQDVRVALPMAAEANAWSEVLGRWASVLLVKPEQLEEAWTLDKLARHTETFTSIDRLEHGMVDQQGAHTWLNNLYALIASAQRVDLFDKLALLPVQTGTFAQRSLVKNDTGIDEELKDIAAKLNLRGREELLDRRIDLRSLPKLQDKTQDELLAQLIQAIGLKPETKVDSKPYREANVALFTWLVRNSEFDKLQGFPCFSEATSPENPLFIRLAKNVAHTEEIPLAPCPAWPQIAQRFADLFPDRYILADDYFVSCPDAQTWQHLSDEGFVRLDPVFEAEGDGIEELLSCEPLPDLESGKQHGGTNDDVRFSSISFLSTKNTGVIDRARGSQTRARQLLHFLAEYVCVVDKKAFEAVNILCQCGATHNCFRAAWLRPLRERTWVPTGDKQHDCPNAESFSKLLHGEPEFLRQLAQGDVSTLVEALGIGRSELLLRVSTSSEAERVSLVASALDLNEAVGNDTTKLKAIADALRSDPDVLKDIEKASATRRLIRRNQSIGSAVEKCLRELLESPGLGFKVKRRPIGRDFDIEYDFVQPDGTQQSEIGLEISGAGRSILLEVKASTAEKFGMTPTQAETAVKFGDTFVLCLVRLPKESEVTLEEVRSGARFVVDIASRGLRDSLSQYALLLVAQITAQQKSGEVELEINDVGARFRVGRETWEKGVTFEKATELFRQKLARGSGA